MGRPVRHAGTDGLIALSAIVKRSVTIAGHPTSVSLEQEFWDALKDIARQRNVSLPALIADVDKTRTGGLSSALRVFVLKSIEEKTHKTA